MSELLSGLNDKQKEAVITTQGPLLVLAGAGSGKTTVLTKRVAYILENNLARPWQILAITFTNKAAAEMASRLKELVPENASDMWIKTFHIGNGYCHIQLFCQLAKSVYKIAVF